MHLRSFLPALSLVCALHGAAQSPVSFYPEEWVVTANSLNLREKPDVKSKKVASLPQGTVLKFLEAWNDGQYTSTDTTDENAPYGRWLKVNSKWGTGWLFDLYVSGTMEIFFEGAPHFDGKPLPPLYWYGVYARDSFADELRSVQVRLAEEDNDFFGVTFKILKTNQDEQSKFLVASHTPLPTGYCGPMGSFDASMTYYTRSLGPGSQMSIYPGNDLNDTLVKPSYGLAATGCATFEDYYVQVKDYRLILLDYSTEQIGLQDLTHWVRTEYPEVNPVVDLLWFGDLDRDNKPDAVIQDCPYEVGCRASLFLSSKAKPGEFLRKVCEYYWPGE